MIKISKIYFAILLLGLIILQEKLFAKSFYDEALNYIELKQFKKAIESLKKSLEKKEQPEYIIFYYIALCHYNLKNFDTAITNYQKAIELKSDWYLPYHNIGLIFFEIKSNFKQAEIYLNKAINLNPVFGIGYFNLGNLYIKMNEPEKAIKIYENGIPYIQDKKILSKIHTGIGNAYDALKNYSQAIISYKKAIEADPENYKAYINSGLVLFKQDLYDDAIENFRKAINLNIDKKINADVFFYIANCYRGLKKFKEMESFYLQAINLNPYHKDAIYALASYYAMSNNKNEMLKYLNSLFSIDKQYIDIILKEKLFENYKNDEDFKKLISR